MVHGSNHSQRRPARRRGHRSVKTVVEKLLQESHCLGVGTGVGTPCAVKIMQAAKILRCTCHAKRGDPLQNSYTEKPEAINELLVAQRHKVACVKSPPSTIVSVVEKTSKSNIVLNHRGRDDCLRSSAHICGQRGPLCCVQPRRVVKEDQQEPRERRPRSLGSFLLVFSFLFDNGFLKMS